MSRSASAAVLILVGVLFLIPLGVAALGAAAVNPIAVIASSVLGATLIFVGAFGNEQAHRVAGEFVLWFRV